jgi:exonuclease SbcC
MLPNDASFDVLRQALQSLYAGDASRRVEIESPPSMLLLRSPTDVAAFSVLNGDPQHEFDAVYRSFKQLYRDNHAEWDQLSLSFVVCRSSDHAADDRFYAHLEHDPLFCRKYVIRAHEDVVHQRSELLRLPFLPLPTTTATELQRPRSAQDYLQTAGLSPSLARKLVETGHRSAERIAAELRDGEESLPDPLVQPSSAHIALTKPRAYSRLKSLTVESFRAYRKSQDFDLDGSVVVLYGPNGLGKTSIFDALDYACTGRIGRLCRQQRRSQAEFARMATHLDKTPGTGSVVLTGRSGDSSSAEESHWSLKRGTGDWTSAWMDGDECDRKTVLNKLTHANWPESTPRQHTLESLFRATHLFGQDEQELLVEFRKGSVIPEAFISEMLALQDYSQGLDKVTDVIAQLSSLLAALDKELSQLRNERHQLSQLIDSMSSELGEDETPTPIDELAGDLRKHWSESGLADTAPPDTMSSQTIVEWQEVLAARLRGIEDRIAAARSLRDQLPNYRRQLDDTTRLQKQLLDNDQELQAANFVEREASENVQKQSTALRDAETELVKWSRRRDDLRSIHDAHTQRRDLNMRIEQLQEELARQTAGRSVADSRLSGIESTKSDTITIQSNTLAQITSLESDLDALRGLIENSPDYVRDTQALSQLQFQIPERQETLRNAEVRKQEAAAKAQAIKLEREALLPEFERASANQADLDQLLDSIQTFIHEESCPLCGTPFESWEALLQSIRERRARLSEDTSITVRYKTLIADESRARDLVETTTIEAAAAGSAINDLVRARNDSEQRVAINRERLARFFGNDAASVTPSMLLQRRDEVMRQLSGLRTNADVVSHNISELDTSRSKEMSQRNAFHERVAALERDIQFLSDKVSELNARISPATLLAPVSVDELDTESGTLSRSIDDNLALVERRKLARADSEAALAIAKQRVANSIARREDCLSTLEGLRQSTANIEQQLRALELPDDCNLQRIEQFLEKQQRLANSIRRLIDKAIEINRAIKARENRLQLLSRRQELASLDERIAQLDQRHRNLTKGLRGCNTIERLLKKERQTAIESHISAYGPLITNIQQRLRSVYGFGGVQLEARGGEAVVQVEWRNKSVQVPPTDFFSDSQKQILMLSIFLAGGLRQNWSGFAPVLLDDPVTHFDDLNAYGFVELVRGIITTYPNEWQFIISTCEERLFALMQKKFARLPSRAIFYEFVGMSEDGPIVERR